MMLSSIYSVDETAPAMKLSPDGKTKLKHAANDLEVSWIMDASHISPQSNNPIIHHPLKLACREIPLPYAYTLTRVRPRQKRHGDRTPRNT
jgi:hypothetical protein